MNNETSSTNTNDITITFSGSNIAIAGFVLSFCSLVIERDFNMSNKHKHYDMIVAKAANIDLVVFIKPSDGRWREYECGGFPAFSNGDYFLCLPQHKEACLHWLSGGEIEYEHERSGFLNVVLPNALNMRWASNHIFMGAACEIRIKPKKEKRWIVYRNGAVYGEYLSPEDINDDFKGTGQIIEIEVEV